MIIQEQQHLETPKGFKALLNQTHILTGSPASEFTVLWVEADKPWDKGRINMLILQIGNQTTAWLRAKFTKGPKFSSALLSDALLTGGQNSTSKLMAPEWLHRRSAKGWNLLKKELMEHGRCDSSSGKQWEEGGKDWGERDGWMDGDTSL